MSFRNFSFEHHDEVYRMLLRILQLSTTNKQIDLIEKLAHGIKANIEAALKDARSNIRWADKNIPTIIDIIKQIP